MCDAAVDAGRLKFVERSILLARQLDPNVTVIARAIVDRVEERLRLGG